MSISSNHDSIDSLQVIEEPTPVVQIKNETETSPIEQPFPIHPVSTPSPRLFTRENVIVIADTPLHVDRNSHEFPDISSEPVKQVTLVSDTNVPRATSAHVAFAVSSEDVDAADRFQGTQTDEFLDDVEAGYFTMQGIEPENVSHLPQFNQTHLFNTKPINLITNMVETSSVASSPNSSDPKFEKGITTNQLQESPSKQSQSIQTAELYYTRSIDTESKRSRTSNSDSGRDSPVANYRASVYENFPSTARNQSNRASVTSRKRNHGSSFYAKRREIFERFVGQKQILLVHEQDATLFDQISQYKVENPAKTLDEASIHFSEAYKTHTLANLLLKSIYGQPMHGYIIKYNKTDSFQLVRDLFEYEMLKEGLFIEKEVSIEDTTQVFIKVYSSFSLLARTAEKIRMKKLLKTAVFPVPKDELDRKHSYLMRILVGILEDGLDLNQQYAPFRREHIIKYADYAIEDHQHLIQDEFFSEKEQLFLTHRVLESINIYIDTQHESKRIGIHHLLHRNIYTSLFCLHHHPRDQELQRNWAHKLLADQPLEEIRSYFGEKIAFHFAFKGFYVFATMLLAAMGLIVFVFGIGDVAVTMSLKETRNFMRLFDNALTLWFALVTSIWGLLFILFWQRKINFYRYVWNLDGALLHSPNEDEVRHQFKPKGYRQNVITGEIDVYFPASYRFTRQMLSFVLVLVFWCMAVASIIGQAVFSGWIKNTKIDSESASTINALFGLGSIWVLRLIFSPISKLLTDWENYKTDSHYEKALLFKRLSFEFINVYGRLLYFAFWRPIFSQDSVFGRTDLKDTCVGPCSTELMYQLLFIILADVAVFNAVHSLLPMIRDWVQQRKYGQRKVPFKKVKPSDFVSSMETPRSLQQNSTHYIDDKLLPQPTHTSFAIRSDTKNSWAIMDHQVYQILQFGYMTLFIAAFPVGGILTGFSNILQLRHEARLFLNVHKRGPPMLPDIATMKTPFAILRVLAIISVTTNSLVIAFTSGFFQRDILTPNFSTDVWWGVKFGFVLLWHVVVFLVVAVLEWLFPVVPSHVKIGRQRQRFVEGKVMTCNDDV